MRPAPHERHRRQVGPQVGRRRRRDRGCALRPACVPREAAGSSTLPPQGEPAVMTADANPPQRTRTRTVRTRSVSSRPETRNAYPGWGDLDGKPWGRRDLRAWSRRRRTSRHRPARCSRRRRRADLTPTLLEIGPTGFRPAKREPLQSGRGIADRPRRAREPCRSAARRRGADRPVRGRDRLRPPTGRSLIPSSQVARGRRCRCCTAGRCTGTG